MSLGVSVFIVEVNQGSLAHLIALLLPTGYVEPYAVDYEDIFSPFANLISVLLLFSFIASFTGIISKI